MIYLLILMWGTFLVFVFLAATGRLGLRDAFPSAQAEGASSALDTDIKEQVDGERVHLQSERRADVISFCRSAKGLKTLGTGFIALVASAYMVTGFNSGFEYRGGKSSGVSSTEYHFTFGSRTLYVPAGKNILIKYDVTLHSGSILIFVKKTQGYFFTKLDEDPDWKTTLTESGKVEFGVPVSEKGLYRIFISEWRDIRLYHGKYRMSWRVR